MLHAVVNECIHNEKGLGLGESSLEELKQYLTGFADHCKGQLKRLSDLSPLFLKDYVDTRCENTGTSVVKALVGSLRKFGALLSLRQYSIGRSLLANTTQVRSPS